MDGRSRRHGWMLATPPAAYMALFFVAPALLLLVMSFWSAKAFQITPDATLANYVRALSSAAFQKVTWNAVWIGLAASAVTLALGLPLAYYLTFVRRSRAIYYLVLITWFSSYLVRIYAWRTLLGTNGLLNSLLLTTGLVEEPVAAFLFSPFAVLVTLVHIYLPFAVLLLVAALRDVGVDLVDAARDLGAGPLTAVVRVVIPNALTGVLGTFVFTFILVAGDYVTPQMLGGSSGQTTGLIIADQFRKTGNWPLGAAQAFLMVVIAGLVYLACIGLVRLAGLAPRRPSRRARPAGTLEISPLARTAS
jgi:spermidine/putrescine transport system permease protein